MKKNLVLLGMMAVGKTTLAKIVAKELSLEFIDTDSNIVKKNSMTIVDIFKKKGELFFRNEEKREVIKSIKKKNCVISIGGGAFVDKAIRDNILQNCISIWLNVNLEVVESRIKKNKKRPLLLVNNYKKKLKELYLERSKIYQLANYKIECNNLSKNDIANKIIELYDKK